MAQGSNQDNNSKAADLIREKISHIYDSEPNAKTEAREVSSTEPLSKHQKFMQQLVASGKNIAAIQTDWHNYYLNLSDKEKKEVWQEFYSSNQNIHATATPQPAKPQELSDLKNQVASRTTKRQPKEHTKAKAATAQISKTIRNKVSASGQLKVKHHIQSLLFGLGMGALVIFIFLFGFFNEVLIAPFIQPSRNVTATPVIIGTNGVAATSTPEVIIPKINVEIPVDYSETSTNENVIENDLEGGVVHYPTTVLPGQLGNAAFFGHSSNNIFNPGKYKFAFVLLHTLVKGDTFYLTYNHTVYVYKVISTFIVSPNDVSVLGPVKGQTATATLITCDPPGTSINRLIVIGQQISPDPSTDTEPTTTVNAATSTNYLPGNGPTLWTRFIDSTTGKTIVVVVVLGLAFIVIRQATKQKA